MINSNLTQVKTYVGEDGLIHFTDSAGADTVLNFSSGGSGNSHVRITIKYRSSNKDSYWNWSPATAYYDFDIIDGVVSNISKTGSWKGSLINVNDITSTETLRSELTGVSVTIS